VVSIEKLEFMIMILQDYNLPHSYYQFNLNYWNCG